MSEMDQYLAELYGTGMSGEEKVAAETEKLASELQELEGIAAMEMFKEAIQSEGLNVDDYSDEDLAQMFNAYYEQSVKTASAPEETDEEIVKEAWTQADEYGRQVARAEFIDFVKEAAGGGLAQKGTKLVETFVGATKGPMKQTIKSLEAEASKIKQKVDSPLRPSAWKGKLMPAEQKKLQQLQQGIKAEKGKMHKETAKQVGIGALGLGAAGAPAAAGAGAAGAGYAAGQKKESSLQLPFLDDAIIKKATLLAVDAGVMTPNGEINLTEDGNYAIDPSEWAGQYDTTVKTAFDETVHALALNHLENLGFPVDRGEE